MGLSRHRRVLLHQNGRALLPEMRSEAAALIIRDTNPSFLTTFQGLPQAAGSTVFDQGWYTGRGRYDPDDSARGSRVVARFLSWDTAESVSESAAFSALCVFELDHNYFLDLRYVRRQRVGFVQLLDWVIQESRHWDRDGKLDSIIIEDKSSGRAVIDSLIQTTEDRIAGKVAAFTPLHSKIERANQASVWCRNGSVRLPNPSPTAQWLHDFESELFSFPNSSEADQVDSFAQAIIFMEHYLVEGYHARLDSDN